MALTAKQRNALPASAFVYHSGPRSSWRYPVPTKAQARKAGISERQRVNTHRNALSRSAQANTMGTHSRVRAHVAKRHAGTIKSVKRSSKR
jgi:hypothetical protein